MDRHLHLWTGLWASDATDIRLNFKRVIEDISKEIAATRLGFFSFTYQLYKAHF